MLRRSLLAAPALLLAAPLRAQAPLSVVVSFSILADIAREVGGERVRLRSIVGPDQDSHGFQPRPSDAEALRGARIVVQNGLGFDNWMRRMREAANWQGRVITATNGITPIEMDAHHHGHGHNHGARGANRRVPDPHVWQDARHVARMAQNIADGLAAADAPNAALYRERATAQAARMEALDAWVRAQVATVPAERRRVITSHDAFGYFAQTYGVEFLAPQGVSTHSEPSAAQVANLIRQIRERQITAVFMDNVANPATLNRLATEAGVRIRGRLYADALSREGGPAPNIEAMFRHNLGLMVPAMRGEA
jgi:zinc/manganese transport system substrate-binding protein